MKLKKKFIGARTFVRSINSEITVNEKNAQLLKDCGRDEFFQKSSKTEEKEEGVEKSSDEDLTLEELRSKYPKIKATSKKVFLSKIK